MYIPKIGEWHVIILHFPIVLFYTGLVFDLLGALFKVKVYPAGHWIVIMAAVLTIPTVITGLELTDAFEKNKYFIIHRNWGLATLAFGLLHGYYRCYILKKHKMVHPWILSGLSLVSVFLVSMTADWGGLVGFGYGFLKHLMQHHSP